jgi:hypothetical protein
MIGGDAGIRAVGAGPAPEGLSRNDLTRGATGSSVSSAAGSRAVQHFFAHFSPIFTHFVAGPCFHVI